MEQRKFTLQFAMAVILLFTAVSCSKDTGLTQDSAAERKVELHITGDFNDFSSKAGIENVFRMTWAEGAGDPMVYDSVYVYGKASGAGEFSCLGKLGAEPDASTGNRVADLRGTITRPEADTKLTLVYSPLLDSAPAVSEGAISIDLSAQEGKKGSVVFVTYTSVDYKADESATYRSSFSFATSVLRVNVSGLLANMEVTKATLEKIETGCKLAFADDAAPAVTGCNPTGTITRTFTNCYADAKGCAAFYVAVPAITENAGRTLSVVQIETEFGAKDFATGSKGAGNMMNSIVPMKILDDPSSTEKNTTNSDPEDLNI